MFSSWPIRQVISGSTSSSAGWPRIWRCFSLLSASCCRVRNRMSGWALPSSRLYRRCSKRSRVLPCFLSARPGALCGLGFVYVSYVSVPIVLLAAIGFVATAEYRALKVAGLALAATSIGVAAAAQMLLSPSHPEQCAKFAEVTKRSNCLRVFADRTQDEQLCRAIEFRTTRFTCLREIAVEKRRPQLCEERADTGPIAPYESPAAVYRDTCFQNLAYAMHDHGQCAKVENAPLRTSCEAHNP